MQIWGSVGKMSKLYLNKRKGILGEEYEKTGLLSLQGKIGTTAPDLPGKMTVFQFGTTFPTVLSLKSGFPAIQNVYLWNEQ